MERHRTDVEQVFIRAKINEDRSTELSLKCQNFMGAIGKLTKSIFQQRFKTIRNRNIHGQPCVLPKITDASPGVLVVYVGDISAASKDTAKV